MDDWCAKKEKDVSSIELLYQNTVSKKITNGFSRWDRNNMVRCCEGGITLDLGNKKGTGIGACRTGVAGFEPTNDGVKVRCLTAWLYPNNRMVGRSGFEPLNPKERIYSPPRLASSLPFLIIELMARDGIEPPTHGASIHCSTN